MNQVLISIKLTALSVLLLAVVYPLAVSAIVSLAPDGGTGQRVLLNGRVVGFQKIGQPFRQDHYFWGRPSAVGYNAAASGGSNKSTTNPTYLAEVQERTDSFLARHPYLHKSQLPSEMVTASGSGLDPHISPQAAEVQIKRVAKARALPEQRIKKLVQEHTQLPLWGVLGPACVHVLELNVALDKLQP